MQQRATQAASATEDAHAALAALAEHAMRTAAQVVARAGGDQWLVAARLWEDGLAARAARAGAAYVDALAALAPEGPPRPAAPELPSRDEFVVPIANRIAVAQLRARAAARTFAKVHGPDSADVHQRTLLAVEASRVAHDAAVSAWREAAAARMDALDVVTGWRRVAEPGACGACLALMDGSVHPPGEPMVIHTRDRCIAEPVVRHVNDRQWGHPTGEEIFRALTDAEQDARFAGRGGAAKAQLIRDRRIAFGDLAQVAAQRLDQTPIALAETPLTVLQASA